MNTKILAKINALYLKACKERDIKGYRENLGYDQDIKFKDWLDSLNVSYLEKAKAIQLFYAQMGKV